MTSKSQVSVSFPAPAPLDQGIVIVGQEAAVPLKFGETPQIVCLNFKHNEEQAWGKVQNFPLFETLFEKGGFSGNSHQTQGPLLAIEEAPSFNFLEKLRLINYEHEGKMFKNFDRPQLKSIY